MAISEGGPDAEPSFRLAAALATWCFWESLRRLRPLGLTLRPLRLRRLRL